ncbi:MAG: isoprenylcysteine carboxylmethyltransferase family protein [Pseudomonadota bacterium]
MQRLLLPPVVWFASVGAMVILQRIWPLATLPPDACVLAWMAGGVLVLAGLAIAQWHARLFKRIGTNINTFGEPGTLTTAGLFAYTRNPMYLGMLLALAGVALALGTLSPWLLVLQFFVLAQCWYIPLEERKLAARFGRQYADYCRDVRRWI